MKRGKFLLLFVLLLIPISINAQEITYSDSKVQFEIDESEWTKTELNQERTYIDKKWTSDCGMIATGSYDIYNELSEDELDGITREYFNYKNLFASNDFAETVINEWKDTYNITNWSYKNYDMKFIYASGTTTESGIEINFDMYMTINNGYGIIFQYMKADGINSSTCSNTIDKIVKTAKSTITVKEENSVDDGNFILSLLIGIFLTLICYMAYPFIRTKLMHIEYDEKSCKKMSLWNSIIVGGIFLVLTSATNPETTWSAAPAFLYYWINKSLWVSKKKKSNNESNREIKHKEDNEKETFTCDNCGAIVSENDTYCTNCNAKFVDDKCIEAEVKEDNEEETFTCDNCGATVGENDTYCTNCNAKFDDDENNEEEELFKCDNCGALVKESAIKCPKCGEVFEDENDDSLENDKDNLKSDMDQKYNDLTKLKKLLDKEIISKEEFEKEKKKILNNK